MENKEYLKLCGVLGLLTVLSVLFVPGLSESLESRMLTFLGNNARAEQPY